jgi:hypothetical protein
LLLEMPDNDIRVSFEGERVFASVIGNSGLIFGRVSLF